jgi:hypothetical protein
MPEVVSDAAAKPAQPLKEGLAILLCMKHLGPRIAPIDDVIAVVAD